MVISLTTSQLTAQQAQQVEDFQQGLLPKVQRKPGVVATYHFHRLDAGESTALIVWETDEARQAYRESELIEEALAYSLIFQRHAFDCRSLHAPSSVTRLPPNFRAAL